MSQAMIAEILTMARKVDNYLADATSNWDSTTVHAYTVPSAKRWIFIGGALNLDTATNLDIVVKDASDQLILELLSASNQSGVVHYPVNSRIFANHVILDAGDYIEITCATAQGASTTSSCVVLEIPY